MKISLVTIAPVAAALAAVAGVALAEQDRSQLKIPDGLSFSEFKGYEDWQPVSTSQTDDQLKIISANPTMIKAYRSGLPAAGKKFPDGSKAVKLEWSRKKDANFPVWAAGDLVAVEFIEKDSKRFPKSDGWAYAFFEYDQASQTLKPKFTGTDCGHACHTKVAADDFVFTHYPPR